MRRMAPLLIALAILATLPASLARAEESSDPLAQADALYRDGKFAEAAAAYREALEAGLQGARVQYNLANALYRSGAKGEAIAHYEAALTAAPRDADIRANLNRALSERPAGRPAPSASWLHAAGARVVRTFTLSEFAAAAALGWWLTLAALAALLLGIGKRRRVRRLTIALAMLTLALTGFAIARWWAYHVIDRGVVTAKTAQLRTGPGESFEVAMPVQEGWTLRVLRRDADWAEIIGEGGVHGWLPTSSLVMVRPDVREKPADG